MYVLNSKQTSGATKASSEFSVLGAQTQGACVQKTKTTASRRGGKDRGTSIVNACAALARTTTRSISEERDYQDQVRHARVFSDRTFEFLPLSADDVLSRFGADMVGLTDRDNIYLKGAEALSLVQALNNLQHSHTGFVLASAIEGPTRHWLHFLPREAQGKIYYALPGEWDYHQLFRQGGSSQAWQQAMTDILSDATSRVRIFGGWLSHEYTIFNWNTGAHWGSSLIHMQKGADGRYSHVAHIGVMDPMHHAGTVSFIHKRLRDVLTRLGCTFEAGNIERTFWFPRQTDGHSCGLISAYCNRLLIERIVDLYLPSGPKQYDDTILWQPAREYLSPRQIQGELAGLCALQLMKVTNYNSRIAVALVKRVTNEAADPTDALAQSVSSDPTRLILYPTQTTLAQSRPPPVQSSLPPMQSSLPPVQSRPVPVQSRPAPVQQNSPPPVQSRPVPVQNSPPPVQSRPVPVQSSPPSGQLTAQMANLQFQAGRNVPKVEPNVRNGERRIAATRRPVNPYRINAAVHQKTTGGFYPMARSTPPPTWGDSMAAYTKRSVSPGKAPRKETPVP